MDLAKASTQKIFQEQKKMEWVLIFQLCSAIYGNCSTPVELKKYNKWSDCVRAGAVETIAYVDRFEKGVNENGVLVRYWCYEDKANKTPVSSKHIK